MASNPSVKKRQKEASRKERASEKAAKKEDRKTEKAARPPGTPGVDPDLEGIVFGPQPVVED